MPPARALAGSFPVHCPARRGSRRIHRPLRVDQLVLPLLLLASVTTLPGCSHRIVRQSTGASVTARETGISPRAPAARARFEPSLSRVADAGGTQEAAPNVPHRPSDTIPDDQRRMEAREEVVPDSLTEPRRKSSTRSRTKPRRSSGPGHLSLTHSRSARTLCRWRERLRRAGLLLTRRERAELVRHGLSDLRPLPQGRHKAIIKRYGRLRRVLGSVRRCLGRRYRRARGSRARRAVIRKAETVLVAVLDRAVLPLWIGTPWNYYGTVEAPHAKWLACGYFVVHALRAAGFRFPDTFIYRHRIRGRMRIFEFAKLHSFGMARLVSGPGLLVHNRGKSVGALAAHLKRLGPGVYLLALDFHILLVLYDGKRAALWHSDYSSAGAWVKRQDLFGRTVAVGSVNHILGKLSRRTLARWLLGRGIRVPRRRRR